MFPGASSKRPEWKPIPLRKDAALGVTDRAHVLCPVECNIQRRWRFDLNLNLKFGACPSFCAAVNFLHQKIGSPREDGLYLL